MLLKNLRSLALVLAFCGVVSPGLISPGQPLEQAVEPIAEPAVSPEQALARINAMISEYEQQVA